MSHQIETAAGLLRDDEGTLHEVAADVVYRRIAIVNVCLIGTPRSFVLVDAGLPLTAALIEAACEDRFGSGARPDAILMTHGHFDHVGALETLAAEWDVPVYAHELERPYLDGSAAYPPGDSSVDSGLMAKLAPLYPTKPVDVSKWLRTLPADHSVPFLPGWRWLHTPGHSVGHVSFWRESDRLLVAGDAVITTDQESAYAAAFTQEAEIHGPPRYFTVDWDAARDSARAIAALQPLTIVSGHGRALSGPELAPALQKLADAFNAVARPERGTYLTRPAHAADGSAYRAP